MQHNSKLINRRTATIIWFISVYTVCWLLFGVEQISAGQKRLTKHRLYFLVGADGAGKIYFIKHETGKFVDLYRINEDGTGLIQLTNDTLLETAFKDRHIDIFPNRDKIAVVKKSEYQDHIYTMNADGSNVRSIYTTMGFIWRIKVSPDGTKIAFMKRTPAGLTPLYIVNSDGTNPRQVTNITAQFPHSGSKLAFSPDSREIAYSLKDNYHLVKIKIDGTGFSQLTNFRVYDIYWLKSNKIVFRHYDAGYCKLATINPDGTGYTVIYSTPRWFGEPFVSPDETKFAVISGGNIVIISIGGVVLKQIPVRYVEKIYWSSNTRLVFRKNDDPQWNIFTINIDGTGEKNLTNNNLAGIYLVVDAKGNKICYADLVPEACRNFYTVNTDGSNQILLFSLSGEQEISVFETFNAQLSPDGSKLLYVLRERTSEYLYIRNTDGTGATIRLEGPVVGGNIGIRGLRSAWSPDGKKIMYCCYDRYGKPIHFISNPDGSGKKVISFPGLSYITSPIFSPDSTRIMFRSEQFPNYYYCSAPVDLSTYTVVLSTTIPYEIYDWKSDKVLLVRRDRTGYSMCVMNSDGSGFKYIDHSDSYYSVALSPDGSKILYELNKRPYVINTDGTGKKMLLDTDTYGLKFLWSPDSQKIAYIYSPRMDWLFRKIYLANPDGSGVYNLNPSILYFVWDAFFVSGNKIVYSGDLDVWCGDYEPFVVAPPDVTIPKDKGTIKIVVPEGGGFRGTYNPDTGKPVNIGFKGESAGKFTIRIFSLLGELIHEDSKESTSAEGYFEWLPKDKNIASGVYIVHIEGPGVKTHRKLVILR